MILLNYSDPAFFGTLARFIEDANTSPTVTEAVRGILQAVRERGDAAILEYVAQFERHHWRASDLQVAPSELDTAYANLPSTQREDIHRAIECVRAFHRRGLPHSWTDKNPHGATVGERWYPLQRVGIYIPAGSVPLVSTVVMTATLAQLAGVPQICVCTPAGRDGRVSPQMLAALKAVGVSEVYRIGGAQAVAAMAYGSDTIRPCVKVMGPGNAYVAEAQRQLFGTVGIDLTPGPSEALAYADASAQPRWLAADLLAQAEHGSGREKVYYVYTDEAQRAAVAAEIEAQLPTLRHAEAIRKVLDQSTVFIRVSNESEAIETINFIAPEHLELHVAEERIPRLIDHITTAGAILCGHHSPTVLGDFTAGPSHTLPTGRTGRFFSGLKITDFMRRSSIVAYDRASLEQARRVVATFAQLEALDAHGRSLEIRCE